MGIGRPSSMLKTNSKFIEYDQLSIHSFVNGFSFCKDTGVDFLTFSGNALETFSKGLEEFLAYYPQGRFQQISWIVFDTPSAFVPTEFYSDDNAHEYIRNTFSVKSGQILQSDALRELSIHNLYCIEESILTFLKAREETLTVHHSNSILLAHIASNVNKEELFDKFYVHLQRESFELFHFRKGALQVCNRFEQHNVKEFLYFLFFAIGELATSSDDYEIIFLGKFHDFSPYYKGTEKILRQSIPS